LPHNLVGMANATVSLVKFLNRNRNYPAQILEARNPNTSETVKVLFVNINTRRTVFVDDTFPSGHSTPSALSVDSPDPARAQSLVVFFHEQLVAVSEGAGPSRAVLAIVATLLIMFEMAQLFRPGHTMLFASLGSPGILLDLAAIAAWLVFMYKFLSEPVGLMIRDRETSARHLLELALRGELRDNPLVSVIANALGTVLGGAILWLLEAVLR